MICVVRRGCLCRMAACGSVAATWGASIDFVFIDDIRVGGKEQKLLSSRHFFYGIFPLRGGYLVREVFQIYGCERSSSPCILGSLAGPVSPEALFKIVGPARIESAVAAF